MLINSGDWMPFSRLLTPYLPVVALLAGAGVYRLRLLMKAHWIPYFESVLLLLTTLLVLNSFWTLRGRDFFVTPHQPINECYRKVGLTILPYLSDGMLVAPEAIGTLGYTLGEVPIMDFFGLANPYIARHGVIPIETYNLGKHNYEYVMQQDPALFFFHSHISNHIPWLNQWDYSQEFETFRITDAQRKCQLLVGVRNPLVPMFLPVLDQAFDVLPVDTTGVQENPLATWPEGIR
jgi:hypothetical protein